MRRLARTLPLLTLFAIATPLITGCDCPFLAKNCSLGTAGTPTTPSTTPSTTFAVAGRIVSTAGASPIAGATVNVGGTVVQSNSSGAFSATLGTAASSVTASASGFLTRTTSIAGNQERNVAIDLIPTSGFDLDFFDRLARGKDQVPAFEPYIVRWQRNPSFYLITKITRFQSGSFYASTSQDVPQATLDRIHAMLATLVRDGTGGRYQVGRVDRRADARPIDQIEEGFIQVELAEGPGSDAPTVECGYGGTSFTHSNFTNERDRRGFARMYLTANCTCGGLSPANVIVVHEVGHALGFGHTHPHRDSVMSYVSTEACGTNTFSARDRHHAALAYLRPIGNTSPDNDPQGFSFQRFGNLTPATMSFSCPFPGRAR